LTDLIFVGFLDLFGRFSSKKRRPYTIFDMALDFLDRQSVEEISQRGEIFCSGNGWQILCGKLSDSSLDPVLKNENLSRAARSKEPKKSTEPKSISGL
jgi:hypothetical protein